MRGRTISIFLPDANPKSVKICEISNSIVKAILIPRSKTQEFSSREELESSGVYLLIGEKTQKDKYKVYIGEAEVLKKRIKQHNASKDFWNIVICFISEKGNINKAHIKFLENYLCEVAGKVDKCELENSITPTKSKLTEQEKEFILGFSDDVRLIVSSLGFNFFEEHTQNENNIFYCKGKDAQAKGEYSEDGFTVFKGSTSNLIESKTAGNWIMKNREKLLESGVLKENKGVYIFTENFNFSSPSSAAAVVLARRANGWTEWKNKKGKTLDELIRK